MKAALPRRFVIDLKSALTLLTACAVVFLAVRVSILLGIGISFVLAALWAHLSQLPTIPPAVRLILLAIGISLSMLYLGMTNPVALRHSNRLSCITNLKQIRLALEQYRHYEGRPVADVESDCSMPLLSWRVALQPYFYATTPTVPDITLPWESHRNIGILNSIPEQFRCFSDDTKRFYSSYVLVHTTRLSKDSADRMILPTGTCIVELHGYAEWTRPGDADRLPSLEELEHQPKFYEYHDGVAFILHNDGSIEERRR